MPVRSHPPRVTGAPPSEKVKRKINYLISFHFLGMKKKRSNMFFKCRVSVFAISFKDKPGNTYEYFIISQRYHHNHSVTYFPIRVFFSSICVNVTLAIYIHHYQHEELYSKKGKKKEKIIVRGSHANPRESANASTLLRHTPFFRTFTIS